MIEDPDETLGEILDARGEYSARRAAANSSDAGAEDIASLLEIADLLWEADHGAPPLSEDPVAAMLGLVPDPDSSLDGKALSTRRKSVGLSVGEVAARLTTRGWTVRQADVFRWETKSAADVSPALLNALAFELGVPAERLIKRGVPAPEREAWRSVVESPSFKALAERWARIQGMSAGLAASALESRMLATVHRGDHPQPDQLLHSLEELVRAFESDDRS